MRFRAFTWSGLLLAALCLPAQEEEGRTYFSLNTDRPVRPGEAANVRVQAWGVDRLQFRLYRVGEPLTFFERLDDPHQFGGSMRPAPRDLTPLERFHRWKRRVRGRIRDVARAQFTPDNRARIRLGAAERERQAVAPAQSGTSYAAVPLLNPQQVVRVWEQPVKSAQRWDSVNVPLEVREKGLYVVEATDGARTAYTIVSVTDLAVLTKTAPGRVLVRVVDRASGAPVEGCTVLLWDHSAKKVLVREKTGAGGVLEGPLDTSPAESLLVLARTQSDFAASTVWGGGLSTDPEKNMRAAVYTDRPVYRPGHTVRFKSILRTMTGAGYELLKATQVPVLIEDPEGQAVLRKTLNLTPFGTAAGEFILPASAALGYYSLRVGGETGGAYGGFQVEEYRKPEYEVRVRPALKRVIQGTPAKIEIEARYYYGEPVPKAKVTVVAHKARYWRFGDLEDREESMEGEEGYYGGEQVLEQAGVLDEQGRLTVEIPTERGEFDLTYRVEARVTDAGNREIAGAGSFLATQGSFFLTVRPEKYVYGPSDKVRVLITAQDYDGKNLANVDVQLDLLRYSWPDKTMPVVFSTTSRTGANGEASVEFTPPGGGSYQMRASSSGVKGTGYLWISGEGGYGGRDERLRIVADRKSYKPGDTARVLLITNVPNADVWLGIEGRTLYATRLIHAQGTSTTVDIPITSAHEPNFFVDAVFVKNNKLHRGSKSLRVPPDEKTLKVEVKTPKAEYQPGERATFSVEARDYRGQPVAAELSLGIVDEAIYAIRKEAVPDLLAIFYGRTYNRVQTDSSFYYHFFGEAGTRRMQLARLRPAQSRGQLKPERMAEPKIRKAFPDTLYWAADLKTGADGRAEVQVEFPDALTLWRATARGVTPDTKVGSAINRTVVRKNLVLSLATPRFFTEADEITVPAMVRNYLPAEKTVRLSLEAQGLEILEGAPRDIAVGSKNETKVDFRAKVLRGSTATLLGKALATGESDALELTIPVYPPGVRQTVARAGSLSGNGRVQFSLAPPAGALEHTRSLEITLSPSVAGALFSALEYLTTYPYGCVEQTMSSFLPNVIVTQAVKELKLSVALNEDELTKKTRAGLERLYGMQHEDGGWGWWTWDETHPFMTAYVTAGLVQARDAGYKVRADVLDRARAALSKQLDASRPPPDLLAYQVYALAAAGGEVKQFFERGWEERNRMSGFGVALLGLAAMKINDARSEPLASILEASVKQQGEEAWWPATRDELLDFNADATPEASAFALKFLAAKRPNRPLLDRAALWLVNHREEGSYWTSTKQTAMVIYGLTDYLRISGELKPDFTVTGTVNGKPVAARRFGGGDFASSKLTGDAATAYSVDLTKSGPGRLYWSATASAVVPATRGLRTGGSELSLKREYFRMTPAEEKGRIVYSMTPLEGTVRTGDLLAVRLTLGGEGRYLMVEDPFASGAEAVDRDERYEFKERPPWWQSWADRRELRDNRAVFFERMLTPQETKEFTYLLKITNPGRFAVSPARVTPMYQPQVMTATEPFTLEVQPR